MTTIKKKVCIPCILVILTTVSLLGIGTCLNQESCHLFVVPSLAGAVIILAAVAAGGTLFGHLAHTEKIRGKKWLFCLHEAALPNPHAHHKLTMAHYLR